MKQKLIQYISSHSFSFYGGNYILLDYSAGTNKQYYINLVLLEKLIEKHFNIHSRLSYLGVRELKF